MEQRISIIQRGLLVPRYPHKPLLASTGCGWQDIQLERHRLIHRDEGSGVTRGYQLCLNMGAAAEVTWQEGTCSRTRLVKPKQISVATHGQVRAVAWAQPMHIMLVGFSEHLLLELCPQSTTGGRPELEERHAFDDAPLATLLQLLHADAARGSPAGPVYGEQLGIAAATYIVQRLAIAKPKWQTYRNGLPGPKVRRVLDLIEAKLQTPLGLRDLASAAGVSYFHFARLFRNSVGETPARYLTARRVERVKQMLRNSEKALPEIALATGFCSQSHMTAVFHKWTGTTPRRFERSNVRDIGSAKGNRTPI